MQKVLVVGGFGFLGSHVVRAFERKGYHVEAASRRSGLDASDEAALGAFLDRTKPDVVVHCAGNIGGIAHTANFLVASYEDNLQLSFHLFRSAYRARIKKFVNILTNCTYPRVADIYTESRWWDGPMDPTAVAYAMAKKALWTQAWAYKEEYGFSSIHLLLPNLYGPGDNFDVVRSHALGALIRKMVDAKTDGHDTVEVWGTGKAVREWLYVQDAAAGIVLATERYEDIEPLNLGVGKGCSIAQLAEMIRTAVGWEGKFVFNPSHPDGTPLRIMDMRKMIAALGWIPPTRLRDGIDETVRWYTTQRSTEPSLTSAAREKDRQKAGHSNLA